MSKPITCIIIDDNDLDRLAVEQQVAQTPQLQLLGSFSNAMDALAFVSHNQADVLFVDVDMPAVTGLDFIRAISGYPALNIIISSHPEYALDGFELKVFDFILKPLEAARFTDAINRVKAFRQMQQKAAAYDVLYEKESVLFKDGPQTVKLGIREILYLEAYGDYTKIVTTDRNYLTLTTLTNFLTMLPQDLFLRIHRSFAVFKEKVKEVGPKELMVADTTLPIGKTFYKSTRQAFHV